MIPLEEIKSIPERWRPVLEQHGLSDARAFAQADAAEVEVWFADDARDDGNGLERWPKAYQVRWMQAEALTAAEAEAPSPAKWFLAIHDLSVEGTLPFYDVPSGQRVNLFYRTDAEIERLIGLRIIAPLDADVHLLVDEAWLPASARRQLNAGGIYTLEGMVADKAVFGDETVDAAHWLTVIEPDVVRVADWFTQARQRIAVQAVHGGGMAVDGDGQHTLAQEE